MTFRDHVRTHVANLYPVAANLSPAVKEELHGFLRDRADAMFGCEVSSDEKVSAVQILGVLDGKQLLTLNAAVSAREIDAATLQQQFAPEENVGITAWNNRLAGLSAKSLLIETSVGRAKRYRLVLENLEHGR